MLGEGRQSGCVVGGTAVCVCVGGGTAEWVCVLGEGRQCGCVVGVTAEWVCCGSDGRVCVLCGVCHVDCIKHQPMKADSLLTARIIQPLSIKIAMFSLME